MTDAPLRLPEMTREQLQAHFDERSINIHDADKVAALFSESAVQRRTATGEAIRGREAIRELAENLFRGFPDIRFDVRSAFGSGDRLCAEITVSGTFTGEWKGIPPTGRRFEVDHCFLFRVGEDGLVEEETVYMDTADMLRQLGLLPGG